jgi:aromatic-L-amino-acid decarboxylase
MYSSDSPLPPDTPLELGGEQLRQLVDLAMPHLSEFLDSIGQQPAWNTADRQSVARAIGEPLPAQGAPAREVLDRLFEQIVPCSFNTAGPGYLAYIPGGGLPEAAVADLIGDCVNRYAGFWPAAPGAAELEATVVRWLCEIVGYGAEAGGFLTSGGSLANFSAIFTARRCRLGDDLSRGTIYTSDQAHASVRKAAMLAGLAHENVQVIPADSSFRISLARLEEQIAADRRAGLAPFAVIANAGTTNTGAVDELAALADLAERENLWLHVDAAYGGFFLLTERGRARMRGIERADSVVLDPHKGLFLPYGTGSLLVRRLDDLRSAHRVGPAPAARAETAALQDKPDYMRSSIDYYNLPDFALGGDFQQLSPELSRPFRGLRVWLPLKLHGSEPFRRNLDEKLDLAAYAATRLRELPQVEMIAEPELSLLAFRVRAPGRDEHERNRLNERVLELVNSRRRVFLSPTVLSGRIVLRICVLSFRTHRQHIEACLEDLTWAIEQATK